ncbi:hypothetical protein B0I35DRAFT_225072 [Stachybotrys elegans]|uniref:DUF6536 domain-containing protein n=1 Tax=Stachybotrys elegans TaxID=80388 RepID=A0A8K0WSL8_9HYPO|nr:hypothetical protein B0I35DRAFT_225072 [Stachybotrys elegans]
MGAAQQLEGLLAHTSEDTSLLRKLQVRVGSWRVTVFVGVVTACLVLAANVALLIWAVNTAPIDGEGTAVVFEGSCEASENATLWPDLLINILSTLLLGASNNCAQILAAPAREDIDKAHANGEWLDIGVPSVRNLFYIPRKRVILWLVLFSSSIPLHLVYNSVVFRGLGWISNGCLVVTEDFAEGRGWNKTRIDGLWLEYVEDLEASVLAGNFTRLENDECIRRFANTSPQTAWSTVLLVTYLDIYPTAWDLLPGDAPEPSASWKAAVLLPPTITEPLHGTLKAVPHAMLCLMNLSSTPTSLAIVQPFRYQLITAWPNRQPHAAPSMSA